MCAQKQRFLDRNEKYVNTALWVYQRFYELSYRPKVPKTFEEFAQSRHYNAFIKFGRYLLRINAIRIREFVDFLIKASIPMHDWESPLVYETFVREINKRESPDAAIERNVLLMEQWAMETGEHWTDFFRKLEPALATLWICSGRISPWVLYTAASAADLMERFSNEQLRLVTEAIDPAFWGVRLDKEKDAVYQLQSILDEAGV